MWSDYIVANTHAIRKIRYVSNIYMIYVNTVYFNYLSEFSGILHKLMGNTFSSEYSNFCLLFILSIIIIMKNGLISLYWKLQLLAQNCLNSMQDIFAFWKRKFVQHCRSNAVLKSNTSHNSQGSSNNYSRANVQLIIQYRDKRKKGKNNHRKWSRIRLWSL